MPRLAAGLVVALTGAVLVANPSSTSAVPARVQPVGVERTLPGITTLDLRPNDPPSASVEYIDASDELVVATAAGFVVLDTATLSMTRREVLDNDTRIDRSDDGSALVAVAGGRLFVYDVATWLETGAADVPSGVDTPREISFAPGRDDLVLLESPGELAVVGTDGSTVVAPFDSIGGVAGSIVDAEWGDDDETLHVLVGTTLADVDISTGTPAVSRQLTAPTGTVGPLVRTGDALVLADGFSVDLGTWEIGRTFPADVTLGGRRDDASLVTLDGLDVTIEGDDVTFRMPAPFDETTAWITPLGAGRLTAIGTDGLLRLLDAEVLGTSWGDFHAVRPERIFDSRLGLGQDGTDPIGTAEERTVDIDGSVPVPADEALAVVVNVTVTLATEPTFVSLYPTGGPRPLVSNVNVDDDVAGRPELAIANLATVPLGDDGTITVFNANGSAHVIIDVAGYYANGAGPSGARYVPLAEPVRVADTRDGFAGGAIGPDATVPVDLAATVSSTATAAVVQITAIEPTSATFLTAAPSGGERPFVSNVNPFPGRVSPNLAVVQLSGAGSLDLYNFAGSVDVAVDLFGYYETRDVNDQNGRYVGFEPVRRLDTREVSPFGDAVPANGSVVFPSVGIDALEPISTGDDTGWTYLLNLTAVEPTEAGFLTVRPIDSTSPFERPTTSNANFGPGEIRANHAYVVAGPDWEAYNSHGDTHIVVDIFGAITPAETLLPASSFG